MKRPLAYLTAAWSGEPDVDMELAAHYCRLTYEAGFSPICPLLYLPLFLNDSVPEEHKAGIDMRRDMLRRSHKVEALDLGANDYITKPFGTEELLARIRAVLRSHRHSEENESTPGGKFRFQDLLIDYDTRQVFVGKEEIDLTQTEYNIMAFLSIHAGKVLTYTAIIHTVWGYSDYGSVKKLQVNMKNIRKKMGVTPGEKRYIINELGVGYRMLAEDE